MDSIMVQQKSSADLQTFVKNSIGAWRFDAVQAILKERNRASQKKDAGMLFLRDTQQENQLLEQMIGIYDTIALKAFQQYVGYSMIENPKKNGESLKILGLTASEELCRYASHFVMFKMQNSTDKRWIALMQAGLWSKLGNGGQGSYSTSWLQPYKTELTNWSILPDCEFNHLLMESTALDSSGNDSVFLIFERMEKLLVAIWFEWLSVPNTTKKRMLLIACAEMEEFLEKVPLTTITGEGRYREKFFRRSLFFALKEWFLATNHLVTYAVQLQMGYFEEGSSEAMKSVTSLLAVRHFISAAEWFQRCNLYDLNAETARYSELSHLMYWMAAYSRIAF